MFRSWHFLCLFAGLFVQHCSADGGDDFSNNLFSDLAPVLALFGERVTMQFLSQSAGWADCIIFATAPLGIMTAIVSAIRVGGPSWLKALVGRSRENISAAEMELMSSTSKEACELWNGRDVVRCQGSASIYEFIILLPQGMRDEATRKLQKVRIMRLQDAQSTLVKRVNPEESNVWTQFSRWLGLRDWTRKEHNEIAVKVDNKEEDPERGQQQQGAFAPNFPQLEPEEQTAHISVDKEPIINNSQVKKNLENLEEEIVIMRNTEADAPNITFNRPKNVGHRELYFVATFGIVLQLGVLLFFGFITYYPTLTYQKDGKTVVAYACPFAVVGTVVLVSGMLLCSHVVDSTTREDRYEAARGKKAQMIWLQQETTSSDQLFSSVALFPPQASKVVTTSSRVVTENPTEHGTLQKTIIETKAIIGTAVGLLGFIIQFIGLRGMHWSASIAQLIAVAIMTAMRAWVRRGFTDELRSKRLSQSYELDWLALNLGDPGHVFWSKPTSETAFKMERHWKIVTGENESLYEALEPRNTESQSKVHDVNADSSTISNRFNAQGIMMMRRNLAKLTNWHGPAREQAIRLTQAIEVVMNSLFAPKRFERDNQQIQRFIWPLYVEGGPEGRECIQLHVDTDKDKRAWKAYADEVEAVLSLWLYSARNSAQNPEDLKSQRSRTISTPFNVNDDTWLRAEGPHSHPALRLVGPYTRELHRDLGWWTPDGPFNFLKVIEGKHGRREPPTKLEVERRRVVGCGASYESRKQIDVPPEQRSSISWGGQPTDRHTSGHERVLLSDDWHSLWPQSPVGKSALAVESYDTIDKLYALDLLSAFMWAAAKTLRTPIDEHSELQKSDAGNERQDAWKFFTLKSESLSNMAESVHNTGLGSLQDVYLSIVPPLSINHKLPELDAVVELVSDRAIEFRHLQNWEKACNEYIWLFRLATTFPTSSFIYSKAAALLLQYHATLVQYRKSKGLQSDGKSSESDGIEGVIRTVGRHLETIDSGVLSNLKELQSMQGRPWDPAGREHIPYGNPTWLADPENAKRMHLTKTHLWTMSRSQVDSPRPEMSRKETEQPDIMGWRPLHYAVATPERNYASFLLGQGADPNVRDIWECTPVHYVPPDEPDFFLDRLKVHGGDLNAVSIEKRTALHYSALRGDLKLTESLIARKADTRIRDIDGRTPIHLAAIQGRAGIMTLLEGDVELADDKGQTPLHLAALNGQYEVAKKLVQIHGNLANLRGERDHMPLHFRDGNGETPIFSAVRGGNIGMVEFLIEQGASFNNVNDNGTTPLHAAVENGNLEMTNALLKAGALILNPEYPKHTPSWKINTPLTMAVWQPNAEILRTLLEANADSSGKAPLNELLGLAISRKEGNLVKILLEAGADANSETEYGSRSLFQAAEGMKLEIVKLLLEAGAVANAPGRNGETALHPAAAWGHVDMAKLLINAGADPNARYPIRTTFHDRGDTPLHSAAQQGNMDMAKLLLEAGASANTPNDNDNTPLHTAAKHGKADMTKLLLKAGACVNAQNKVGSSPLAAVECVEVLLQFGADVNITDMNKRTALHEAAKLNRIHAMELLIQGGADVNVVDIDGQTALDVFLDAQHESAAGARILEKAGAAKGSALIASSQSSE